MGQIFYDFTGTLGLLEVSKITHENASSRLQLRKVDVKHIIHAT